jgi:hypothetical protein
MERLNPARLWRRPATPAPRLAAAVQLPVQRELSLDTVRVLRNDLSDADTEAARGRGPTAARNSAVSAVTAKAELAMDRISSKFFGAGEG